MSKCLGNSALPCTATCAAVCPKCCLPASPRSAHQAVSEEAFAAVVCRHLREHLEERTHVRRGLWPV